MPETREHPPPFVKTSIVGPLGGDDGGLGAPTTFLEDVDGGHPWRQCQRPGSALHLSRRRQWWAPWEVMRRPGSTLHLSQSHQWQSPWEAMPETRECPPPFSKTSMAGALEGDDRGPGASTTFFKCVDGRPPRRQCQRSEGAHHLS
jgi:hypothetical protein